VPAGATRIGGSRAAPSSPGVQTLSLGLTGCMAMDVVQLLKKGRPAT
jgi:uncharacterized OsmC-like protein